MSTEVTSDAYPADDSTTSHATCTWASTNARSAEFVDSSTIHGDFAGQRFSAQVAREVLAKQAVHFWEHC